MRYIDLSTSMVWGLMPSSFSRLKSCSLSMLSNAFWMSMRQMWVDKAWEDCIWEMSSRVNICSAQPLLFRKPACSSDRHRLVSRWYDTFEGETHQVKKETHWWHTIHTGLKTGFWTLGCTHLRSMSRYKSLTLFLGYVWRCNPYWQLSTVLIRAVKSMSPKVVWKIAGTLPSDQIFWTNQMTKRQVGRPPHLWNS